MVVKELDSLDCAALAIELNEELKGAILKNVYQLIPGCYLLRFYIPSKGTRNLIVEVGRRINLTDYEFLQRSEVDHFTLMLRRHLRGLKVREVKQYDFDRVIEIAFKRGNKTAKLIVELIGRGNLILLDKEDKILVAYDYFKGRIRQVIQGHKYSYPPPRGLDPTSVPGDYLKHKAKYFKGNIEDFLLKELNVSRSLVREAIVRARVKVGERTNECADYLPLVVNVMKEIIEKVRSGNLNPKVVITDGIISPYPLDYLSVKGDVRSYRSFNKAIDESFREELIKRIIKYKSKPLEEERRKLYDILERQKRTKEDYLNKAKILKELADTLFSRLDLLKEALKNLPKDLDKVRESLNKIGLKVVDVKLNEDNVTLSLGKGITVNVPRGGKVTEALSKLYEEYKKYSTKAKRIEEEIRKTESKITKLNSSALSPNDVVRKYVKRRWYENFLWFLSSEGFLVIGGKDASQNETLVKKYMMENDIFLHADIHGGPVVIVKAEGKEIGKITLKEAATLAAAFSRAWQYGFSSIDVFWVYGRQVSKSPPSGEYLRKGSFMVYGRRNYLKGIPLRICIGIDDECKLMVGPESLAGRLRDYLILSPGNLPREAIVERLSKALRMKGCKGIDKGNIATLVPKGGHYIIKSAGILAKLQ